MRGWSLTHEARLALDAAFTQRGPIDAIRRISDLGVPAAIPRLTVFLDPRSRDVATEALTAIRVLLRNTPPSQLRRLDKEVRGYWPYFDGTWVGLKPAGFRRLAKRGGDSLTAAAICSMHRNGHIREQAVIRLSEFETGEELPYLVLRAVDWVDEVRGLAQRSVQARLREDYLSAVVASLVLFEGRSIEEGRGADLMPAVEELLSRPVASPLLLKALEAKDHPTRRAAARWFVRARHEPFQDLLERALRQDDLVVASYVAQIGVERYHSDQLLGLVEELRQHRIGRIRALGLWTLLNKFPERACEVLTPALFDSNAGVREMSQHALVSDGDDPALAYRQGLPDRSRVSLLGLAEAGTKADASLARPYLDSPEVGVRRAATRAVAALDAAGEARHLIRALGDESRGVSREARKGLSTLADFVADDVWSLVQTAPLPHVRTNAFRLLARLGKWRRLLFALRAASSSDEDLQARGERMVAICLSQWNRSYAAPTPDQVEEVVRLTELARPRLGSDLAAHLDFSLGPHRV